MREPAIHAPGPGRVPQPQPALDGSAEVYLGAMSGTSLDGVDVVRVVFRGERGLAVTHHHHQPFEAGLRRELLALNQRDGVDELHRAALAANTLSRTYAQAVAALLATLAPDAAAPTALGAHGQTVRHLPGALAGEADGGTGYTLQLLNGALLAERTGLSVVCDFRSRDVAAGGQGAPLVPAFHARCFGEPGQDWAVLNLGGIGNLSLGHADGRVTGFDCGPGNALMDHWCERHRGRAFDEDGAWADQGQVHEALLRSLLSEPFLRQEPPKSTGRDLFHPAWLQTHLDRVPTTVDAADVQATLTEYSAQCAADALRRHGAGARRLLVCGGGALNGSLMRRLAARLPDVAVQSTAQAGLPPLQVEAAAFAWLARAFIRREPGNLCAVTGARAPRVLGALYPA